MKLKVSKKKVLLGNIKPGSLFMSTNGTMGLKSEYRTEAGAIEAYIVGSGEMFWGGTSDPKDQPFVEVHKVKLKK